MQHIDLNNKTILVTGSPGFIGANLVIRLLKEMSGGTVVSLDKEEMKVLNKVAKDLYGCKFNELDFEDQDEIYCYAEDNGLLH